MKTWNMQSRIRCTKCLRRMAFPGARPRPAPGHRAPCWTWGLSYDPQPPSARPAILKICINTSCPARRKLIRCSCPARAGYTRSPWTLSHSPKDPEAIFQTIGRDQAMAEYRRLAKMLDFDGDLSSYNWEVMFFCCRKLLRVVQFKKGDRIKLCKLGFVAQCKCGRSPKPVRGP